jgi:hypothetical protein
MAVPPQILVLDRLSAPNIDTDKVKQKWMERHQTSGMLDITTMADRYVFVVQSIDITTLAAQCFDLGMLANYFLTDQKEINIMRAVKNS